MYSKNKLILTFIITLVIMMLFSGGVFAQQEDLSNMSVSDEGNTEFGLTIEGEKIDLSDESLIPSNETQIAQASLQDTFNPPEADAGFRDIALKTLTTSYDVYCSVKEFTTNSECELNSSFWSSSQLMQHLVFNPVMLTVCDKTLDDAIQDDECLDPTETVAYSQSLAQFRRDNPGELTRIPGGASMVLASTYAYITDPESTPVPTNFALYVNDEFGDTLFGTPAYAQTLGAQWYENIVLELWKFTRNIALALFGLMLAVAALMVMFRTKISPQVTVSIYNVLPMIPIVLGLIVLSYPILALMYSFIGPLLGFAWTIGNGIISSVGGLNWAIATDLNAGFGNGVIGSINAIISWAGALSYGALSLFLFIVVSIIALIVLLFVGLMQFVKVFISFITTTVLAPFVFLLAIIPGKQGLILNLFKKALADVLAIPVLVLVYTIALAIVAYSPAIDNSDNTMSILSNAFSQWGLLFVYVLKTFIAFGIMWKARKIRPQLNSMLGVHGLFGAGDDKRR